MDVHLKSIRVSQPQMIEDQQLILLDDIVTSGNSIHACKKLLLDAGAFLVQSIALGATTWELHA